MKSLLPFTLVLLCCQPLRQAESKNVKPVAFIESSDIADTAEALLVIDVNSTISKPGPRVEGSLCDTDFCCNFDIEGNAMVGGLLKAVINCNPGNNNDPTAVPTIYFGDTLYGARAGFSGVNAATPNEPGFLSPNAIFFVSSEQLTVTISGSFIDVGNSYSPLLTIEKGFDGVCDNCIFRGNSGQLHGVLAVSSAQSLIVRNSQFLHNTCLCDPIGASKSCADSTCHNGGVYVTEGSSATIQNCHFEGQIGHFGAALLVTSGSNFEVVDTTFVDNSVDVVGSFGGGIFFNLCTGTNSGKLKNVSFVGNTVDGWGGGLAVDGCALSTEACTFVDNSATISGAATYLSNTDVTISGTFRNNVCVSGASTCVCPEVGSAAGFLFGSSVVCSNTQSYAF